jgi:hypothetical protein
MTPEESHLYRLILHAEMTSIKDRHVKTIEQVLDYLQVLQTHMLKNICFAASEDFELAKEIVKFSNEKMTRTIEDLEKAWMDHNK